MKGRWEDRELTYDDQGAGAPVVLLHPFPFDRRYWQITVAALGRAGRRVITVDARGFGESTAAGPFAIVDLADDLEVLLDGLGISSAAVVGLSMGGYTALAFAQRHAARLAGLILADTRAGADSAETRRGRDETIAQLRGGGPGAGDARVAAGVDTYLDRSLPRLLAPAAPATVRTEARALAETRADRIIAGLEAMRDRPDRSAELAAIRCPTLVLAGALDQVVPVDEMRRMGAAIPGSRFTVLDGVGHLSSLEAPAPFATALRSFLDETVPR